MNSFLNNKRSGFTLIELIVVIVVIALLATIAIVSYNGIQQSARDKGILSDMSSVEGELARYATKNNGKYSTALNWNSDNGTNANISFTPSMGNVILVTIIGNDYCIRGYNPSSNADSLENAKAKGNCTMKWSQVGSGYNHTCGIGSDQLVYCWGRNGSGELGNNTTSDSSTPTPVYTGGSLSGKTIKSLSVGFEHTCVIASDDLAYCWGSNNGTALGNNSSVNSLVPVPVSRAGVLAGKTMKTISSGRYGSCGIASDNLAYCWGDNDVGQLGNNSTTDSAVPVAVTTSGVLSGKTIKSLNYGGYISCAIASDNLAYCWGTTYLPSPGTSTDSSVPIAMNSSGGLVGKTVKSISAGYYNACAIASDNLAYCWGYNTTGAVGNNTKTKTSNPTAVTTSGVLSGKTIKSISAAAYHSCAIASDNKVYCWGSNTRGQLGISASTTESLVPVAANASGVLSGKVVSTISAGADSPTCAITSDSILQCWGRDTYGQVGNGSVTTYIDTPTLVAIPSI